MIVIPALAFWLLIAFAFAVGIGVGGVIAWSILDRDEDSGPGPAWDEDEPVTGFDQATTVGPVDITSDSIPVVRDVGRDEDEGAWARQMADELSSDDRWDDSIVVPRAETRIASEAAVDVARAMAERDQEAAEFCAGLADMRRAMWKEIAA